MPPPSYGTCPCSGHYEARLVEVRMNVDGESIVFDRVPQGACPLCGSRVYKAPVIERLEATMRGFRAPAQPG